MPRPGAHPGRDGRLELDLAHRARHPQRQPPLRGERPIQTPDRRATPTRRGPPGRGHRSRRGRRGSPRSARAPRSGRLVYGVGMAAIQQRRRRLVQHARGYAGRRRDGSGAASPARRRGGRDARSGERGRAAPSRVVVVAPERDGPSGRQPLQVAGGRPATQLVDGPAVAQQPAVERRPRRSRAAWASAMAAHTASRSGRSPSRRPVAAAIAAMPRCRCASVMPGTTHVPGGSRQSLVLARASASTSRGVPPRRRCRRRDGDRLDLGQPRGTAEGEYPARDDERGAPTVRAGPVHRVSPANRRRSPASSSPAPRPRASAMRALGPPRKPAGMAPAAIHCAPPPGKP